MTLLLMAVLHQKTIMKNLLMIHMKLKAEIVFQPLVISLVLIGILLQKLMVSEDHILFIQVSLLLYLDSILIIKKVWFHSNF